MTEGGATAGCRLQGRWWTLFRKGAANLALCLHRMHIAT